MTPHIICHMVCSLDGRILQSRWMPKDYDVGDLFEELHDKLEGDAWIVGRVTGEEFAKGDTYPTECDQLLDREPWFATRVADAFGVILDAHGKIAWGRSDIDSDPIVVVLTKSVSDAHLAGLRRDGVSYIFSGFSEIDLAETVDILARELGIKRLLVEGGGTANGAFLRAGLINEISMVLCPAVDGASGAPSLFQSSATDRDQSTPISTFSLLSSERLDGGELWLRYRLTFD